MFEDDFRVIERRSCFTWYHIKENRQGPIDRTLLQVEDDRSDGIRDFLGIHGGTTAHNRHGCSGSGSVNIRETV